jgi:hypothetical protein
MTHSKRMAIKLHLCLAVLGILLTTGTAQSAVPLIRNNLKVKLIVKEDSPVYTDPSTRSGKAMNANQFSILFVFESGSGSGITKNGFYRVGKSPTNAIGWIHESQAVLWDHRECVRFTPMHGRQPTKVYQNIGDLRKALQGRGSVQPIAEEPGDTSAMQFAMLLPVLDKYTVNVGSRVHNALEVAYLANDTGTETTGYTGRTRYRGTPTPYLDILFVIDTTLSMRPYIEKTKVIVDEIARRAIGMREGGVRLGLRCYRDYGDPEYVTESFSELTNNFREVKRILTEEVRAGPNTMGIPEAVFDGLYAGITETNWSDESGLRVIILVGDASSHPVGDINNPKGYTESKLTALASEQRVRVITLKIISKYDEDNLIHEAQLKQLAQGREEGDQGSYFEIEVSPLMTSAYVSRVASAVEVEIARMAKLIEVTKDPSKIAMVPDSERAIILKNLVPAKSSSEPEFADGWLSERDATGKLQVKPYVFLSFDDLDLTLYYLNATMTLAETTTTKTVTAMLTTISTKTGEELDKNVSLRAQYEKRLGLPFQTKTLEVSLDDLLAWNESRRNNLAQKIKQKIKLLERHRDDPESWYTTDGKFRYTFVPLDYFP